MKGVAVGFLLLLFAACDDAPVEPAIEPAIVWHTDVEAGLAAARKQHARGVMVDVWASWCVPCKQLALAYDDPVMRRALAGWVRVRVDVTEASEVTDAFMERWDAGVPTVLFVSPEGQLLSSVRQYEPPEELAKHVPRR